MQRSLDIAVRAALPDSVGGGWRDLADHLQPGLTADPAWPRLADQLTARHAAGHDVSDLLRTALAHHPLPDELPAAALLWRLPVPEPTRQPAGATPPTGTAPAASTPRTGVDAAEPPWRALADAIDPRLVAGADWPVLAGALARADRAGYDVALHLPRLAAGAPLPEPHPARALHHRLVGECDAAITPLPDRVRLVDDARALRQLTAAATTTAEPRAGRPPARGPAR